MKASLTRGQTGEMMGLLSKLIRTFAEQPAKPSDSELRMEIAEVAKDGRLHIRYRLPETLKTELRFPDGSFGEVKNISYGGLGVELRGYDTKLEPPYEAAMTLTALGQTIKARATIVRVIHVEGKAPFMGLAFCHDTPEMLHYLRFFIDGLRFGSSMRLLPPSIRKEAYQGPDWHCFRGEGPCDLLVCKTATKPTSALLTFPWKGAYAELSLTNGRLSTAEAMVDSALGDHRPGTQMRTSAQLNQDTLRKAAYILASLPQPAYDCGKALLEEILPHLT